MLLVNNENGYILPVEKTFKAVKRRYPDIVTHCDCVQGFMKLPVKCSELNADFISLSAHKIRGAKGVGALYIKKGIRVIPIITGGKQEKGIRSGRCGAQSALVRLSALSDVPLGICVRR